MCMTTYEERVLVGLGMPKFHEVCHDWSIKLGISYCKFHLTSFFSYRLGILVVLIFQDFLGTDHAANYQVPMR